MQHKLESVVLYLVLIISLNSLAGNVTLSVANAQEVANVSYSNSYHNFQMQYPEGWSRTETAEAASFYDDVVKFVNRDDSLSVVQFIVSVNDFSQEISLAEYSEEHVRWLKLTHPNATIEADQPSEKMIDGKLFHTISYSEDLSSVTLAEDGSVQDQQQIEFTTLEVWTTVADKAYLMTHFADSARHSQHLATVERMIDSFVIDEEAVLQNHESQDDSVFYLYDSRDRGLKIAYPTSWTRGLPGLYTNYIIGFFAPRETVQEHRVGSVMLHSFSSGPLSLSEFVDGAIEGIKSNTLEFALVESGSVTIGNNSKIQGERIDYTFEELGIKMRGFDIYMRDMDTTYSLSYTADASKFDAYLPTVTAMTESLEIGQGSIVSEGQQDENNSDNNTSGETQPTTTGPSQCLIATAAFGSELSPQVQFLRNFRDNQILSTAAGSSFMNVFNAWYYSFSPSVADYEREQPWLQQTVKTAIYPLLGILYISEKTYALTDGEFGVLSAGLIASAMIGAVYLSPLTLSIKQVRNSELNYKLIVYLVVGISIAVIGAILIGNEAALMITTSLFVLTIVSVSAILCSKVLQKLIRSIKK